ncbi:MAG: hypothetical protein NVSMB17_03360 [Candidatus Dormibacteria bacterium]
MRDNLPSLGPGVLMVSLDVEPNEDGAILRRYADQNQFPWRFAVAPRQLSQALRESFGNQFLNPPSEPMVIIDQKGVAHLVPYGHRDVARLRQLLAQFSAG